MQDFIICFIWKNIIYIFVCTVISAWCGLKRMIMYYMHYSHLSVKTLRDEQAGFRKERSCVDQISTLRVIVEQTIEWQTSLCMNFIDFEKAFDRIDHQVLWKILKHYGIPQKIISIIQQLNDGFSCQLVHDGNDRAIYCYYRCKTSYVLSPLLFLMVIDWVSKTAYKEPKGIQWTLQTRLEYLDFADDICMLSHRYQDMQHQATSLEEIAKQTGLLINPQKIKTMRFNTTQTDKLTIRDTEVENIEQFPYLGSIISTTGGTDEDIKARKRKAQQAFAMLKPVWRSTTLRTRTKLKLFNSNVKYILLYGSETWRETASSIKALQVFLNRYLRTMLGVRWPDTVSNKELWRKTKQQPINLTIRSSRWKWIWHTLRKADNNIAKQALEWNPQGKRKRCRPNNSWRRGVISELQAIHTTWGETKRKAQDRTRWKETVIALCPPWDEVK